MLAIIYFIVFTALWHLIQSKMNNAIDTKTFITFLTILLLYRDKLSSLLHMIPNFMEFHGRIEYALSHLKDIKQPPENKDTSVVSKKNIQLEFNELRFENVSYKYNTSSAYLIENMNMTIHTDAKIVGVTGISGKGKSTIMKLLLKLYTEYDGSIYIDGVNVKDIDTDYIRQHITYVNQSSKLFDKPVIENMLYGCNNAADCNKYLDIIMKYPFIRKLYNNVDIHNQTAGPLGESLSGGQRQVINVLSGLVNPSPILILDEPTNSLDETLKRELLAIIDAFKEYKKCIIIITHDRDVYPLFNTRIRI
jgi:ABC-type bacteriocin/lantibiotic exporter with double-glycine peptidase domain